MPEIDEPLHLNQELDRLEMECSKLVALLRDRHVGLSTWRFLVGQRATVIQQIMKELGMTNDQPAA